MSKVNMNLSHMPVNVIAISNTHQTYGVAVNTAFMVKNQTYLVQRNIKNNAGLSYILVIQNGAVVYATPVDDFSINNLNNRVLVQGIVDKFVPCDDKVQEEQSKRLPDGFDPSKIHGLPYDFAFASGAAQRVLDLINSDQNKTILIDLSKGELRTQGCIMGGGNITLGDLPNTGFEQVGFPKTLDCGSRLYMVGDLAHKSFSKGEAINTMYKRMYLAGSAASSIPAKVKSGLSIAAAKIDSVIRDDAKVYGGFVIGEQLIIARVHNKSDVVPRAFIVLASASNSLILPINEFEINQENPHWCVVHSMVKLSITESLYEHERVNAKEIYDVLCKNGWHGVHDMVAYLNKFKVDGSNSYFGLSPEVKAIVEASHKATSENILKAAGINKGDEAVALDIAHSRITTGCLLKASGPLPVGVVIRVNGQGTKSLYAVFNNGEEHQMFDIVGECNEAILAKLNMQLMAGETSAGGDGFVGDVVEYYCAPIEEIYGTCRVMDEGEFGITTPSYWSIYSRHQSGISQWVADYADAGLCKSQTDLLNAKLTIK